MTLSESQNKFFMKSLKIESKRVEDFLKYWHLRDNPDQEYKLYDLMDEKYEEKSKDLFKKLYRDGCTQKQLLDKLKEEIDDFKIIYETSFDWGETEVMSDDLFGIDHISFEWTKNMIKQAKKEEDLLNKSKKLKTWEHSYKKAVEGGIDIQELDESIKELISKHLRNIKSGSKKTKKKSSKNSKIIKKGGGKKTFKKEQKIEKKEYYKCIKKCKNKGEKCFEKCNNKRNKTLKKLEKEYPEEWNKIKTSYYI